MSTETPDFEVLWSHRSFGRNMLLLIAVLFLYVLGAVFGSGFLKVVGLVGAIVFAIALIYLGFSGLRQLRRWPAAATLTQSGVTFYRQAPAAWETLREVRLGKIKPRWFFVMRPLYYVAFVPKNSSSLPHNLRYKLAIRIYGTSLILMTQTVEPSGQEILDAVRSFSEIHIALDEPKPPPRLS